LRREQPLVVPPALDEREAAGLARGVSQRVNHVLHKEKEILVKKLLLFPPSSYKRETQLVLREMKYNILWGLFRAREA